MSYLQDKKWKKEFNKRFPCLEQIGDNVKCQNEVITKEVESFIQDQIIKAWHDGWIKGHEMGIPVGLGMCDAYQKQIDRIIKEQE